MPQVLIFHKKEFRTSELFDVKELYKMQIYYCFFIHEIKFMQNNKQVTIIPYLNVKLWYLQQNCVGDATVYY